MADESMGLCDCGHPRGTHRCDNGPLPTYPSNGPCQATVITHVQMGMNITRCKCARFTPVRRAA